MRGSSEASASSQLALTSCYCCCSREDSSAAVRQSVGYRRRQKRCSVFTRSWPRVSDECSHRPVYTARSRDARHCMLRTIAITWFNNCSVSQKISLPSCLHYNFFYPKPILIIFGRIIRKKNYNKTYILFLFMTLPCTLTAAYSMSIQFWLRLIFRMENARFKQKWSELKIKSKHWQNNVT